MDAKFRLDNLTQLVKVSGDDAPEISAKAKDADLVKMHAYRDAITGVTAAIVLYPGSERGFWRTDGTAVEDLNIGDVIEGELIGVGAIPLLPATTQTAEGWDR